MSLSRQILLIVAVTLGITGGIGYVSWQKRNHFIAGEIEEFQQNQLSYVTQVAQKVEFSFAKLADDLYSLSQIPEVQFLEKNTCLLNMVRIQKLNSQQIDSIYRTDTEGRIRYAYPLRECPVVGDQLDTIFSLCRETGRTIFRVVRQRKDGSDYLVIARPVYTVQGEVHLNPSNKFSGMLFFITPLERLQTYFFASSLFGDRGYPWIVTPQRLLISTGNVQHLGKRFDEFLSLELSLERQTEILSILANMTRGEAGVGRYSYSLHQGVQDAFVKLTAYTPLHLPDQVWSIALSNPLEDVLVPLERSIRELRFYSLSLIAIMTAMALLTVMLLRKNHQRQLVSLRRKDEENSLVRREWQVTFDTVDSMVFLLDRELTVIRANQAAELLGQGPAEVLTGRNLGAILAEVAETVDLPVARILAGDAAYSCKVSSKGTAKVFLMTMVPVQEEAGYHVALICYLKDITELEDLQEQYHRAQKMESIGLMAGGVAHDLNNILSGIVSYPELVLMKLPESSELRRPVEMIQSSGMRAAAVVDDLLTVARGVACVKSTENLNALVQTYIESPECQNLQRNHPEVQLVTRLSDEVHNIECSPVHILKCLMNLVANGAEAIDRSGQVEISTSSIEYPGASSGERNLQPGTYAVLTVSDTGDGISPVDQARIFEPFYSKKVMGKSGTGLGLAVVWNTMEDHGGLVEVASSEQGTHFTLYFPSTGCEVKEQHQSNDHVKNLGQGQRILVVDDQELQRDIARQMLSSLGYEVTTVQSGQEALVFLKEQSMDLVVLDMVMDPGMNGCQTYEQILQINPQQKAVIASGYSEDVLVKRALLLGAAGLVKKPYTLEQIGAAVNSALTARN